METAGANMLVNELSQGHERAMELEARLNQSSIELCKSLVHEILASYEKAISMAKATSSACPNLAIACTDSSRSFAGSPQSETSEQPFKTERKEMASKKRKAQQPKWTSQVKLGSGPEAQGPLDDGHSWRKYGQKEILGAKHPRGYYRCTHRNSQGCLAMKQVQKSDDNPAIFEVTYRGTHTCHRKPSPPLAAAASSAFANLDHHSNNNQHLLLSFQTNLKVKTENLDSKAQEPAAYASFSFLSTPMDGLKPENHHQHHDVFSPSSMLDNCFKSSFNTAFFSPATSESNYFSASPCRMSSYGGAPSLQASESDFAEIVSAATSAANSPIFDQLDFLLPSPTELDHDFLLDASTFFS